MASIHEVARMAGVSTATVSKYINKKGYIASDKCERIKEAIQCLSYSPNRSARTLKTKAAGEVLFVVPNVNERIYREILGSLNASIPPEYRVVLRLTNDDAEKEASVLRECLNNPCCGVFLCTCVAGNTELFDNIAASTPVFFILRKPLNEHGYNFIGFDHGSCVCAMTNELISQGFSDIGIYAGDSAFSSEADCVQAYRQAFAYNSIPVREDRIFSFPYSREAVFRSIMRLFDSGDYPRVFITTSFQCAQAISEVAYFRNMELGRDILLFTLGEDSWYNSMFVNKIICTYRDARKLGAVAAAQWQLRLNSPAAGETVNINLQDGFDCGRIGEYIARLRASSAPARPIKTAGKLRLAVNAMDSGTDALKSLIPQFVKQYETDVELCDMDYDDLYDVLKDEAARPGCRYDMFTVDVPWLPYLNQLGLFRDISDFFSRGELAGQFAPLVLDRLASCQRRILGLPYVYTISLLYYRKDLFADPELKRRFYDAHRAPLEPPRDWYMFNLISSFFTRERNPLSPTVYGTGTFGGGFATPICTELYPRVWAYSGSIFDRYGNVKLYSYENYKACLSLVEAVRCSPEDTLTADIYTGFQKLLDGETAMQIHFSSNASLIADSSRTLVRDKIGFMPVPGGKPALSGWSLCVNRKTPAAQRALDFMRWFSSLEISSAYMTLGGVPPITTILEHEPFLQLYPWTTLVREEFPAAVDRVVPTLPGVPLLEEEVVENILADIIFGFFKNRGTLESLLYEAHQRLCDYAEKNGYPRNIPISSRINEANLR